MWSGLAIILVLNALPAFDAKGGRSGGRGSSGSRGGGGRSGGSRSSSSHGGYGGFGRSSSRGSSGPRSSSSLGSSRISHVSSFNAKPSFNSGNGQGSVTQSRAFKSSFVGGATAGAASDYVRYRGSTPILLSGRPYVYSGRSYIFASSSYHEGGASFASGYPGRVNPYCRLPLNQLTHLPGSLPNTETSTSSTNDSTVEPFDWSEKFANLTDDAREVLTNKLISELQFQNGTRPAEIVWQCNQDEVCCGTECCPFHEPNNDNYLFNSYEPNIFESNSYDKNYYHSDRFKKRVVLVSAFGLVILIIICLALAKTKEKELEAAARTRDRAKAENEANENSASLLRQDVDCEANRPSPSRKEPPPSYFQVVGTSSSSAPRSTFHESRS